MVTNGNGVHYTQPGGLSLLLALENLKKYTERWKTAAHVSSVHENMSGQQLQMYGRELGPPHEGKREGS